MTKLQSTLALLVVATAGCHTGSVESSHSHAEFVPINIFTNRASSGEGVLVECLAPIRTGGERAGMVAFRIENLMSQDLFIEVLGLQKLGWRLEQRPPAAAFKGHRLPAGYEHENPQFSLLAAGPGDRVTCAHGNSLTITQALPKVIVPTEWIGAECTVSFWLNGYRRNDGEHFFQPVEFVTTIRD